MTPQWAVAALVVQLVTVFFVPPLVFGERAVFVSDLWCWLWLAGGLWDLWNRRALKPLLPFFATTAALVLIAYAHGAARPDLTSQLDDNWFFRLREHDEFRAGRELVVALRFLSWLWAARVVSGWFVAPAQGAAARRTIGTALALCMIAAGAIMVADVAIPSIRFWLGTVYHFDPDFEFWRGRAYGTFRSPLEGGIGLALAIFLVADVKETDGRLRAAAIVSAICGIFASKSATAVVALAVGALAAAAAEASRRGRRARRAQTVAILSAVGVVAALAVIAWFIDPSLRNRVHDFGFRPGPWVFYFKTAFARADLALLGFGMAPFHGDNIYVWVFTRAGLVGLGVFLWALARLVRRDWSGWTPAQRGAVVFLLVAGLMLDTLIYRIVVSLLIAAALPFSGAGGRAGRHPARR